MKKYSVIALVCAVIIVMGCAVSRVPVYKNDALNEVFWADERFAAELAKIPGVNTPDPRMSAAISALWSDRRSGRYSDAFGQLTASGKVEARDYSSPLEAVLWLYAQDPDWAREVLASYTLDGLTASAWGNCTGDRWDEWAEVRARLSVPSLCAYYTRTALRYIPERDDGKNYLQSPYETILMGGGDCEDFAALIVEALEYNGWNARLFTVDIYRHEKKLPDSHTVACFFDGGKGYFIQGYDATYLAGGVTGPFDQPDEMADFIAGTIGGQAYHFYVFTTAEFLDAYKDLNRGRP